MGREGTIIKNSMVYTRNTINTDAKVIETEHMTPLLALHKEVIKMK